MTVHVARVLDAVDGMTSDMVGLIGEVLRIPSVSGTDAENDAQSFFAGVLGRAAFDVDHWRIDLDVITADPNFPGTEVERDEAWGSSAGASLERRCEHGVHRPIRTAGTWPVDRLLPL